MLLCIRWNLIASILSLTTTGLFYMVCNSGYTKRYKSRTFGWLSGLHVNMSDALTHWGLVTHICVSKQTSIGSDNGLSPGRRQAVIWTNAGILLIGPLGTNFNEISIEIHKLSFKKMHLKMSSGKWRPFCLGLNVLKSWWSRTSTVFHKQLRKLLASDVEPHNRVCNHVVH